MLLMRYFSTTLQCFGDAEYHQRGKVHFAVSMELKEVDKCCCVVTVNEAFSSKTLVSCSGVVVHPQSGIVICTALPFSRFITDPDQLSAEHTFLSPRSFRKKLKIIVVFPDVSLSAHKEEIPPSRSEPVHNKDVSAHLIALVNCLEFEEAFQNVFQEADQWRFHGDDEDRELMRDARFLSWFAVLKTSEKVDGLRSESIPWQSCSSLQKGHPVIACGSPFGSLCLDLFNNTLSSGIISNLTGEDGTVILTDARCLPGTEGGGVFAVKSTELVHLIGVIVSPFCWKANEWIGLTLVCSVQSIFRSILLCVGLQGLPQDVWLNPVQSGLCLSTTAHESGVVKYPAVCLVESGSVWGSGVAVTPQLVVTCRHVVNGKSTVLLKFHYNQRFLHVIGDVLFSTKPSSPYDLALVQMRDSITDAVTPRMAEKFNQGDSVVVVGYGGMGRQCGPSLTSGVISKAIRLKDQIVMLQTTCAVQAGASGGAVVQRNSGELLGIVSSNARDLAVKVTYPHLNFIIPVTVFQRLLQQFHHEKNINVFQVLNITEVDVKKVWRLQESKSKL